MRIKVNYQIKVTKAHRRAVAWAATNGKQDRDATLQEMSFFLEKYGTEHLIVVLEAWQESKSVDLVMSTIGREEKTEPVEVSA